jgi:endonuclease/exonuclease/phosphatase (EEP) superfamily protein YafD
MPGAMREIAALEPDIVLIQESAYALSETGLVRETFGEGYEAVFGSDASIIVRGTILHSLRPTTNHTFARVRLADGRELEVVSMRMQAPVARLDYYTKDCWRAYKRHREQHIEELREIWRRVQRVRTGLPLVMGGDFNLVPDPQEEEVLGPEMRDSFRVAGRGWYATALSSTPIFRIDKVWASGELRPVETTSHASKVSDHRFVVARFEFGSKKQ